MCKHESSSCTNLCVSSYSCRDLLQHLMHSPSGHSVWARSTEIQNTSFVNRLQEHKDIAATLTKCLHLALHVEEVLTAEA